MNHLDEERRFAQENNNAERGQLRWACPAPQYCRRRRRWPQHRDRCASAVARSGVTRGDFGRARRPTESDAVEDSAYYNGAKNAERVAAYKERVERINGMEDALEDLSDEELAAKTAEFCKLAAGATRATPRGAFAVVREAAWRTLELRHYDVQLVGGMALHGGYLAQMGTGEGKTLVATSRCT